MPRNQLNRVRFSSLPSVREDCWCSVLFSHHSTERLTMGMLIAPTMPSTARAPRPHVGVGGHPPERQVPDEGQEQHQGGDEAHVAPLPPGVPRGPAPDAARHQGEPAEHDADLGCGQGQRVPPTRPLPQHHHAAERGDRERDVGEHGHRHVDVEQPDGVLHQVVGRAPDQGEQRAAPAARRGSRRRDHG